MKKFFNFALVAFAAAAVFAACQKPAANNEEQKQGEEQQQEEQPEVKTADLYVVNTPAWEAPVMWAWGNNDAIKMPGAWPNGIEPEAAKVTEGGKDYVHFVLDETFIGEGVGFLILDKAANPTVQTVDAAGLNIKAGDKLYYEIGAEAGADGKFALTPVE